MPTSIQQVLLGTAIASTEADDYFAQIVSAGSTIDSTAQTAIRNFVVGCKTDGVWSLLRDVGPLCGDDLTAALVKLKKWSTSPQSYTNHNFVSGDYSQATGLTGDGAGLATKYLDSGVTPNSMFSGFGMNGGLGIYDRANQDLTNNSHGAYSSNSAMMNMNQCYPDGKAYADMFNTAQELGVTLASGPMGFVLASRTTASDGGGAIDDLSIYRNGVSIGSRSTVGGTLPSRPILFFGYHDNGTPRVQNGSHPLAFLCITAGMTSAQAAALYTRVQALQTALGRNV